MAKLLGSGAGGASKTSAGATAAGPSASASASSPQCSVIMSKRIMRERSSYQPAAVGYWLQGTVAGLFIMLTLYCIIYIYIYIYYNYKVNIEENQGEPGNLYTSLQGMVC